MAKIRSPTGTRLPETQRTIRIKGKLIVYLHKGQRVAASWTRGHQRPPTEAELEQRAEFTRMVQASKQIHPVMRASAELMAEGSKRTWRDYVSLAMTGKIAEFPNYGEIVSQYNLDILGKIPGMIVIRSAEWIALAIGEEAQVLTVVDGLPAWVDLPEAISELTGDVIAGPGSGAQVASLSETGVVPDDYTNVNLTVDAKGRITHAENGTDNVGITQLHGDASAGPGTGNQLITLSTTGVVPDSYTLASFTVDAKGRITSASSGSVSPGLNQLTGDATAGPGTGSQVLTLSATGVVPGSYSPLAATLDAKGRVTAASTASIPAYINQLTGDGTAGPGSGSQVLTLSPSGVVANTYTLPTLTLDAKGRVTSATNGTIGTTNGAFHPGMVSGRLYLPPIAGTLASAGMGGNTLMAYPIYIPNACTINTLRSQVNGAGTATLMEYGIYTNNNGIPDQKVLDAGSIATSPTGVRTISGLTQALAPGWYWIVWAANGTVTMSVMSATTSSPAVAQGVAALSAATGPYAFVTGAWTFSAGNLPTTFPSPTPTTASITALAFTIA